MKLSQERKDQLAYILIDLHGGTPLNQSELLDKLLEAARQELRTMVSFGTFRLDEDRKLI